jgi:hypothetical protein
MAKLQAVSKLGWLEGGGGRDPGKGAGKKIEAAYNSYPSSLNSFSEKNNFAR